MRSLAARAVRVRWAAVLMVAALAGCGGEGVPRLGASYPVKGKVTLPDGKPLARVKLVFSGPVTNQAITSADGTFALESPGLPAGDYKVSLAITEVTGSAKRPVLPFPSKYLDEDASDLSMTVKPEGPNDFDLKLNKSESGGRGKPGK